MKLNVHLHHSAKSLVIGALTLLVAAGALLAATLSKQVNLSGESSIELHRKNANGQDEIIDRARAPFNFTANLTALATGNPMLDEFTSDVVWSLTSEKGRRLRVRLARAAKVRLDSGALTVELPFEVSLGDNTRLSVTPKLTNESVAAPFGQLNGEKISVDAHSLTATVTGFSVIKERDLVEAQAKGKEGNLRTPGVVGGSAGLNGEVIVVYRLRGKAVTQ